MYNTSYAKLNVQININTIKDKMVETKNPIIS